MNRRSSCLLGALLFLAPIGNARAQAPANAPAPFSRMSSGDPAYKDAAILKEAGFLDLRLSAFNDGGTYSRADGPSRYEFAVVLIGFLNNKAKAKEYDAIFQQKPEVLAAFRRLFHEFEPLIAQLGVDIFAAKARLGEVTATPFPDVPRNHWAFASVETLRKEGILLGYPGGTFQTD